jgi:hypothetical protein
LRSEPGFIKETSRIAFRQNQSFGQRAIPRANSAVISSSGQPGSAAAKVFDGDPKADWHSRYRKGQPKAPRWSGLMFGKPTTIKRLGWWFVLAVVGSVSVEKVADPRRF